jgi:hypothetical protein
MFKKVFALASFTALTGVIALGTAAGCSSSTTSSSSGGDTDGSTVKKDASSDRSTTPVDEDAGPSTCPSTDPVAASDLPWAPPTATNPNQCTEAMLTEFQQFLKDNPTTTNDQFEAHIKTASQACHDCIFTDASKPTWGPIPTSGGKLVTINIGACFALASGNNNCGQAIQNEFDCEFVACADCADDTSFQACQKKAQTGACKPYVQAIQSGCQGVPTTVDDVCGTFIETIRIQCVTANVFDGGADP